ncbi:NAD(P)-binding domain-containing protein [Pseudonocardia parietis]|uniref:3-hydroxyisobutyrate dehydrogenase n=1 Tax=Pseudonocardia parietis TaxID=570936 RepID=A0ABS4VU44_9PSEU|nr:NAD(P)-binding domain-containing protein [Pseudonocardia parietis]MBP2367441.1 3-hydroxyisobutyrate dehydrogenase [Pseudonocardia parietis]
MSIVLGLVMSDDIPEAYLGDTGILAAADPETLVLVGSTTTPQMIEQVHAAAPAGVRVLDTPMIGGVRPAREAALTFLVGGAHEEDRRVEDVLSVLGKVRFVGERGSGVAYKLITTVAIMAAEAGIREALDLADILGKDYRVALDLMTAGPLAAVVARALDTTNPRPLRRSAEDDDALLSAVESPRTDLPISAAGAQRLWEAVTGTPGFAPDFVDLTRKTTARPVYQPAEATS